MPRSGLQSVTVTPGDNAGAAVLAFRPRADAAGRSIPIAVHANERPVRSAPRRTGTAWLLLLLGSLAAHAGIVALLNAPPRSMPSAGIPAITVDIVIGDNAAAGLASRPGRESAVELRPVDTVSPERSTVAAEPIKPVTIAEAAAPVAHSEPPPKAPVDAVRSETASAEETARTPADAAAAVATVPVRTVEAVPQPAERAQAAKPPEEVAAIAPAPARPRPRAQAAPSSAASGISRGGSAADASYHGRVAAHLARHKRFPANSRRRGEHGSAGLDFSIDRSGRVTAVRIIRTSGFASLDQAAESMVWRASPFPAPPDRRPQRFRVPISYSIR